MTPPAAPTSREGSLSDAPSSPRLKGARLDLASMRASAGARSGLTVRQQNHFMQGDGSPRRAPAMAFGMPRKRIGSCSPPRGDPITFRHLAGMEPAQAHLIRHAGSASRAWSPASTMTLSQDELQAIRLAKTYISHPHCRVCGGEDLLSAGTKKYVKSDAPPSAGYVYQNDQRAFTAWQLSKRENHDPSEISDVSTLLQPSLRLAEDALSQPKPLRIFRDPLRPLS
eukprot:TRINITY_DN42759_c0_g1_i1.p1 TRINITY_DN42759_c0_g1~~TRINITY_DN42759_c0_g1_i1.p1  ORF type:complete len:226 (+),score=22.50 TRINITY_DN42759_c0_g1_i1:107-784(+)